MTRRLKKFEEVRDVTQRRVSLFEKKGDELTKSVSSFMDLVMKLLIYKELSGADC